MDWIKLFWKLTIVELQGLLTHVGLQSILWVWQWWQRERHGGRMQVGVFGSTGGEQRVSTRFV